MKPSAPYRVLSPSCLSKYYNFLPEAQTRHPKTIQINTHNFSEI